MQYTELQETRGTVKELLSRFRKYWEMPEFKDMKTVEAWLDLDFRDRQKKYPHGGQVDFSKFITVMNEAKVPVVAAPYDGRSGHVNSLTQHNWLVQYVRTGVYPKLAYVPELAKKSFAAIAAKADAERERASGSKGKKRKKGDKTQDTETALTPAFVPSGFDEDEDRDDGAQDDGAQVDGAQPPPKRRKVGPTPAPPLHAPIAHVDRENAESFPHIWNATEGVRRTQLQKDVQKECKAPACIDSQMPWAAQKLLIDWIDIPQNNANHWEDADGMVASKRGRHTSSVRKARVALFNQILKRFSLQHVSAVEKHEDLPFEFRYISRAEQTKKDERDAKLSKSKGKKARGTGGRPGGGRKGAASAAADDVVDTSDADPAVADSDSDLSDPQDSDDEDAEMDEE